MVLNAEKQCYYQQQNFVAFMVWVKAWSLFESLNHALLLFLNPKLML